MKLVVGQVENLFGFKPVKILYKNPLKKKKDGDYPHETTEFEVAVDKDFHQQIVKADKTRGCSWYPTIPLTPQKKNQS